MLQDGRLVIAKGEKDICLVPEMANRHGLIAGATGTGKTVTLKTIAESLAAAGVPVFISDVKGDVSGMGVAGEPTEKLVARLEKLGIYDYPFQASTVEFWDVYGEKGVPVRTSISEMGPVLLARLLGLTDVQQGVLNIVFRVADDMKLLLIDLKDLRSMLAYVGEHADEYTINYGNVSKQSIGAIQRALLQLEDAGGDLFFGEPTLQIQDWIRIDEQGRGVVNILHCAKLFNSPLLYSTFLLWMLTELYENLPEVGDLDLPKICFFFDEAHLLFDDTADALVDKIEQIVKLIRSKGVGVYFITQNPADIPDAVLAQLGNRVQHALRAYTPKEQRGVKAAAESFRVNPAFKTEDALQDLATGEALISFLDEDGRPEIVQRAMVIAPMCSMGSMEDETRAEILAESDMLPLYRDAYDPESAYEILAAQVEQDAAAEEAAILAAEEAKEEARRLRELEREEERQRRLREQEEARLIRLQQQEEAKLARLREQEALKLERIREQEMIRRRREQEQEMARRQREREAQKKREQMERELIKSMTQTSSSSRRTTTSTRRPATKPATTRKPAPRQTPMQRQANDSMTTVGVQLARGILGMLLK